MKGDTIKSYDGVLADTEAKKKVDFLEIESRMVVTRG